MAYSFRHTNPRLTGVIIKEKIRCGRQNCHCGHDNRLHGWYYYLYWREGGKLKKQYVSRSEVRDLRLQIKKLKTKDSAEKINFREYLKLFKELF